MLKKLLVSTVIACSLTAIFSGCASTKTVLNTYSPVAIFSMSSNNSVRWYDDGFNKDENIRKGGVLSDNLNKLVDNKNPEHFTAKDRLVYANEALRKAMEELAGIEVLPEEKLLNSDIYLDEASSSLTYIESKAFLPGYKRLYKLGAKKNRLIMQDIGANGMLHVEWNFEKVLTSGNKWTGEVSVQATLKVYFINNKGKESRPVTYSLRSADRVSIANRKYDQQALVDLFPPVIDSLINMFVMDFIE